MAKPVFVTVSDGQGGTRHLILIETSEENDVPFAVLCPPGQELDFDSYEIYGYDDSDGQPDYFPFAPEVAERLLRLMRDRWEMETKFFMAPLVAQA